MGKFGKRLFIIFLLGLLALVFAIFDTTNSGVVIWTIFIYVLFTSSICYNMLETQDKMVKSIDELKELIKKEQ